MKIRVWNLAHKQKKHKTTHFLHKLENDKSNWLCSLTLNLNHLSVLNINE